MPQVSSFERSQYPADAVYLNHPTFKLKGEITNSRSVLTRDQGLKSVREIDDGAVFVESVEDRTRQAALKHFADLKNNAIASRDEVQVEVYKDIGISFVGVAAAIGGVFIPILTPAIALCAAGVALATLGITKGLKDNTLLGEIESDINTMKDQSNEWKDPAIDVISHRREAGIQGFQYAFKKQLKNNVVHPQEVQQLWQYNFLQLMSGKQSIQQMCNENLLGLQSTEYAWESQEIPGMNIKGRYFSDAEFKQLTLQFNGCRAGFKNFTSAITNELNHLQREKKAIRQEISQMKNRWLLPAQYSYNQGKQTAQTLRQQALASFIHERDSAISKIQLAYHYHVQNPHDLAEMTHKRNLDNLCAEEIRVINRQFDTHPAVVSINQAYERDMRMCEILYNQSELAVNAIFDQKTRKLNDAYHRAKSKIEEQQNAGDLRFKYLMDQGLANPKFFISSEAMPSVQHNWSLPNLTSEPSWNEVYGQAPTFQSRFTNDVSEFAWNHFWSPNGFGRFASSPTSSWSNLNTDRCSTPFSNRCYNLNGMNHNSQPGMFMREVRVPAPPKVPVGTREPNARKDNRVPPQSSTRTATGFASTESRESTNVKPGTRANGGLVA